jgi:hypothetical protein
LEHGWNEQATEFALSMLKTRGQLMEQQWLPYTLFEALKNPGFPPKLEAQLRKLCGDTEILWVNSS